jgi:hypothetical protein
MPFTQDIAATYRRPGQVVRRLAQAGPREDRVLAILMGACTMQFIAQWPRLSREAYLSGQELNGLLAGALAGWLLFAPLGLYFIAWLAHLLARLFRGQGPSYNARIALFWGLLAATPLALLNGLIAGFIGPGPGLTLVGVLWVGVLVWFWIAGMMAVYRKETV